MSPLADKSRVSEDWKEEYEQLSEDFRFYSQMGWEATFAVLFGDALVAAYIVPLLSTRRSLADLILLLVGFATILMGWQEVKWIYRSRVRMMRMKEIDRTHGFVRFATEEPLRVRLGTEWGLAAILFLVGVSIMATPLLLWVYPNAP